jgi:hypothetical protein
MKKLEKKHILLLTGVAIIAIVVLLVIFLKPGGSGSGENTSVHSLEAEEQDSPLGKGMVTDKPMPVYGKWQNFTTKDGLPSDHAYAVKIDGDRVWVGTHDGLSVYEDGKWKTYTTKDGLAHNGVVSIDVSKETGDVWIGTLSGLSRFSAGKFENFNQFNSGLPNDLVYMVHCKGKDIWTATGGGAGHYDTFTKKWEIFTEKNAPMHEPWTYAVSSAANKVYIAAWGGGIIEYDTQTKHFRDYTDPDGYMEIDLDPNDGPVHDITTATSVDNGYLWVSSYFGLCRYDGKNWTGYFDHDSGLASNFINNLKAYNTVVYVCSDRGLSTFNGKTWVTYKKNDNDANGKAIVTEGKNVREIAMSPCISNNFIIGADADDNNVWVATAHGVSHGVLLQE